MEYKIDESRRRACEIKLNHSGRAATAPPLLPPPPPLPPPRALSLPCVLNRADVSRRLFKKAPGVCSDPPAAASSVRAVPHLALVPFSFFSPSLFPLFFLFVGERRVFLGAARSVEIFDFETQTGSFPASSICLGEFDCRCRKGGREPSGEKIEAYLYSSTRRSRFVMEIVCLTTSFKLKLILCNP